MLIVLKSPVRARALLRVLLVVALLCFAIVMPAVGAVAQDDSSEEAPRTNQDAGGEQADDGDTTRRRIEQLTDDRRVPSQAEDLRASTEAAARNDPARERIRRPLLREGSWITDVAGTLREDEASGWWIFSPKGITSDTPHDFLVLPCGTLETMQRAVRMTEQSVIFRISARVYVYQQRNFIVPVSPAKIDRYVDPAESVEGDAPAVNGTGDSGADRSNDQSHATPPSDDAGETDEPDRSARDIIRQMQEQTPRSIVIDALEPEENSSGGTDSSDPSRVTEENTLILSRRGRLHRSVGGVWVFSFDADARGEADPPMTLMPCMLLERLSEVAGRADDIRGTSPALILSGRVHTYRGRNFLLPTVFHLARDRENLK